MALQVRLVSEVYMALCVGLHVLV